VKDLEQRFTGRVSFVDICGDESEDDVKKYNVRSYPTIIIECDGQEKERFVGLTQERFLQRAILKVLSECK
jgi:thioredoxin-like negative regulator of GroEL